MRILFPTMSLALLLALSLSAREWTNSEGKIIEAEFIALEEDVIVLSMKGKNFRVPADKLSESDRVYAQEESERRAKAAAKEARKFMGREITKGELSTFDWPLSDENKKLAANGGKGWDTAFSSRYSGQWIKDMAEEHPIDSVKFALGFPDDFDPAIGAPIFVQWTTSDAKSNVAGARGYWGACREKGWILLSVEGTPDPKTTWSNSVFYAGIHEFFDHLHEKYPESKDWVVATGGFSGGAKICQWMGGLMNEIEGVNLQGYWIGGCNESFFQYALDDLSVSKKSYRDGKAFISSGASDPLVTNDHRERVERGAKAVGLEVMNEVYDDGHRMNTEHFKKALDWFTEK